MELIDGQQVTGEDLERLSVLLQVTQQGTKIHSQVSSLVSQDPSMLCMVSGDRCALERNDPET